MEKDIENIKNLGKDPIVELAQSIIVDKYPSIPIVPKDYKISVWANKTEILVKYIRCIRYVPLNHKISDFRYDLTVNVINKSILPFDFFGSDKFYIPTEKDKKNFEFVRNNFGWPSQGFDVSISEGPDSYKISVTNKVAFGKYTIDKITGKEAGDSIQGSFTPAPKPNNIRIDEDPLIEITDKPSIFSTEVTKSIMEAYKGKSSYIGIIKVTNMEFLNRGTRGERVFIDFEINETIHGAINITQMHSYSNGKLPFSEGSKYLVIFKGFNKTSMNIWPETFQTLDDENYKEAIEFCERLKVNS